MYVETFMYVDTFLEELIEQMTYSKWKDTSLGQRTDKKRMNFKRRNEN